MSFTGFSPGRHRRESKIDPSIIWHMPLLEIPESENPMVEEPEKEKEVEKEEISRCEERKIKAAEKWGQFKLFIWNPDEKLFLRRTGRSWCKFEI